MCFAGKNVIDHAQKPSVAPGNQKNRKFPKTELFQFMDHISSNNDPIIETLADPCRGENSG